jgi:hypothetical protein
MKMKISVLAAILCVFTGSATAQVSVSGYTKKDGTYVAPHYRSGPNDTRNDNYSTRGNINPYTGKEGTKAPEPDPHSYSRPSTLPRAQPTPNPYTRSSSTTNPWEHKTPAEPTRRY